MVDTQTSVHFKTYDSDKIRTEQMLNIFNPWSVETYLHREHMVPHTAQWFQNNLSFAVVAQTPESKLIGAGGVTPVLSNSQSVEFEGQQVFELCSHFVYKQYRGQNIGFHNVIRRLKLVRQHNGLPAIVTTEESIIAIAKKLGMVKTLDSTRYKPLGLSIRDCTCKNRQGQPFVGCRCTECPEDGGKTIWILSPEVELPEIMECVIFT